MGLSWRTRRPPKARASLFPTTRIAPVVRCADARRFFAHPTVVNKYCVRFGGFKCNGIPVPGVHEFLQRFYPRFKAVRASTGGRVNTKKGMAVGRVTDQRVTAQVKGTGKMKGPLDRLLRYAQVNCGLEIVDAHVLVFEATWGVATEIDVLAQTKGLSAHLVVIENKTTLQTAEQHQRTYNLADTACPVLVGGIGGSWPNSEYVHHQLQLAMMVLMCRRNYGLEQDTKGVVLVKTMGGVVYQYPLNEKLLGDLQTALTPNSGAVRLSLPVAHKKYVLPPVSLLHLGLLSRLNGQGVAIPQATTLRTRVHAFLAAAHPGATYKCNVPLGSMSLRRVGQPQLHILADIVVDTGVVYMIKLLLTSTDVVAVQAQRGMGPAMLARGIPNTLGNQWRLGVGARLALRPAIEGRLLFITEQDITVSDPIAPLYMSPFKTA